MVPCVGIRAIEFPWCGGLCEAPCSLIPVATQGAEHKRNPIPVTGGGAEHKRNPIHVAGGGAEHKLHPISSTLLVRSTLVMIVL